MPKLDPLELKKKKAFVRQLSDDFERWRPHFQEVAKYVLPRRYEWLASQRAFDTKRTISPSTTILDPTATGAVRVLSNGLMNGITSPARPWFRLRLSGFPEDLEYPQDFTVWLDECERRMNIIFNESNFYNAQSVQYLELAGFGTSAMLVYEDFDEVIRCYNSPMGEYRIFQDNRRVVVGLSREFQLSTAQMVAEFGLENVSEMVQRQYKDGGSGLLHTHPICHLVEPNTRDSEPRLPSVFSYREIYWEAKHSQDGNVLRVAGFREKPIIAPRWELLGNDAYGTSPSIDALPDIKQLQQETLRKAQIIDALARPPLLADFGLQGKADSLLPGGVTYVPPNSNFGVKPAYQLNAPLGEMTRDIMEIQSRIREAYYNHLFRNVSTLETVRSAAEVYERKAEDMLMLGGILERFQNEALDPIIKRTYGIMLRKELLPEAPPGLDPATVNIQYSSILADAQRAAGTGAIERFWAAVGELGAAVPDVLQIPNYEELVRDYARRLNVGGKGIRSREEVAAQREAQNQQLEAQQAALVGTQLTEATKNLADADVGGGQNALQAVLNG